MRNDVVKYVNSQGQEQFLSKGNCLCNTKALREFLYTVQNKRLYSNQQKTITIELLFHGSPTDRDNIIDILEVDSILNTYGKLYVNDWYILCRFVGISSITKEGYGNIRMNLQFVADTIEWCKATPTKFASVWNTTDETINADYPTDYPSDYAFSNAKSINNVELSPADFIIKTTFTSTEITNKYIEFVLTHSNGNTQTYGVDLTDFDVTVADEFILDTQTKIVGYYHNGEFVSLFGGASDSSYIFKQIETGVSQLTATNQHPTVAFTLIQHRRQPRWMT